MSFIAGVFFSWLLLVQKKNCLIQSTCASSRIWKKLIFPRFQNVIVNLKSLSSKGPFKNLFSADLRNTRGKNETKRSKLKTAAEHWNRSSKKKRKPTRYKLLHGCEKETKSDNFISSSLGIFKIFLPCSVHQKAKTSDNHLNYHCFIMDARNMLLKNR